MYDARFYNNAMPGAHYSSFINNERIQVKEFIDQYKNELDINKKSLQNIFKSRFWTELVGRWSGPNKIMECAMTCGDKFTKVWDQGGSKR
jgi:hypothetical protein